VWITLRIGVLYGAPIVAVAAALAWFVLLWPRAAALYPLALLLAPTAVALIWGTAELASYLSVPAGGFVWDAGEALALLRALLPVAAYVGIPVAALTVVFWITLWAAGRKQWKR
jgi:hypothetical protein